MKPSEEYLAKLLHEKEAWEKRLEKIPQPLSPAHILYRCAQNAANRYYAAKQMYDYMTKENGP